MTTFNDFKYKQAHVSSVQFNTVVDETFTGGEQRRDLWSEPRLKWTLDFEKDQVDRADLVEFFTAQKGRKNTFNWTWDANKGGDGHTYLVRFDTDQLDLKILEMGYSTFSIDLVQVVA